MYGIRYRNKFEAVAMVGDVKGCRTMVSKCAVWIDLLGAATED